MKIIVDAMGGDFAPLAPVKGALMAHERYGAEILLAGKEEEIQKTLRECGCAVLPTGVEIVNATEVVEICDDPATAFKRKKDSSLTVGLTLLRDARGQAHSRPSPRGACPHDPDGNGQSGAYRLRSKRRVYGGVSAAICLPWQLLRAEGARR